MSQLEEIKARSEGVRDLCPDYLRQGIRHLQRNCEVLCPAHDEDEMGPCNQPDRYDGDRMATALRDHAKLIAALEAVLNLANHEPRFRPRMFGGEYFPLSVSADEIIEVIKEALQ